MNYILYLAVNEGNQEIVKELLNHNADIGDKHIYEINPLIYGIIFYYSAI